MYGLPQAGRIAYEQLKKFLTPHGYHECPITPGLWRHVTRPIQFCFVVDDFGVKYTNQEDVEHLINISIPTSNPIPMTGLATQTQHPQVRSQSTIYQRTRHHSSNRCTRRQKSTRNTRYIAVLRPSHQLHHASHHRYPCHPTISTHHQNNGGHKTTPQLLRLQSKRHRTIPKKRHGPPRREQRIISVRNESLITRCGFLLSQ